MGHEARNNVNSYSSIHPELLPFLKYDVRTIVSVAPAAAHVVATVLKICLVQAKSRCESSSLKEL